MKINFKIKTIECTNVTKACMTRKYMRLLMLQEKF